MRLILKTLITVMLLAFVAVSCDNDENGTDSPVLNKSGIDFKGKTGTDTLYTKDKKIMRINMVKITRLEKAEVLLDIAAHNNKSGEIIEDGKKIGEYTCSDNNCFDDIWVYGSFRISRNKEGNGILRYSYKIDKFYDGEKYMVDLSAKAKYDAVCVWIKL